MTDLLRAAILGDHASVHMPTGVPDLTVEIALINPDDAAARVRAMLTSDEAVERAAIGLYELEEDGTEATEKELGVDLGRRFTWAEHAKRWPETADAYRARARAAILAVLGEPT